MGLKRATLVNSIMAGLDWKEEWRKYYCPKGRVHWLAPERFWQQAENEGCPHCGHNLQRASHYEVAI